MLALLLAHGCTFVCILVLVLMHACTFVCIFMLVLLHACIKVLYWCLCLLALMAVNTWARVHMHMYMYACTSVFACLCLSRLKVINQKLFMINWLNFVVGHQPSFLCTRFWHVPLKL